MPNEFKTRSQGFAHKSSLGETGPPFGGFVRLRVEYFVAKAEPSLLSQLRQVASHGLLFASIAWLGVHGVERESGLARKLKSSDRQRVHFL